MRRADGMNNDLCALLSQPACRARVIKMNVREQDVSQVTGR